MTTPSRRADYGMKVLWLPTGQEIDWDRPPAPEHMVGWTKKTTSGKTITGSFLTICHMDHLNRLVYAKWGVALQIIQSDWNTGVSASAGTHDFDRVWDVYIPGVDWWEAQRFLRLHGFACWYRHPPLFGYHIHGFTWQPHMDTALLVPKVGVYIDGGRSSEGRVLTSSQAVDYRNHAFGLASQHTPGSDTSWFPKDIDRRSFNVVKFAQTRALEKRSK